MCDGNCERCKYNIDNDCTYDEVTPEDRKRQDAFDRDITAVDPRVRKVRESNSRYGRSERGKESKRKYAQSERGKARNHAYNVSEKGREARRRYEQSEKGQAAKKRKQEKRIASGKNAEKCHRYYERKKLEQIS